MTKLCPRGKAAAKRKFKVYPSAYANAYASKICAGKIKDPSGVKRKDFRGSKAEGGLMEATSRLKRQGLKAGSGPRAGRPVSRLEEQKRREKRRALGPAGRGKKKKQNLSKLLTAEEFFKIKDSDQKFTGPRSTKGSLGDAINQFRVMDDKIAVKMSKGGRAGLKGGGISSRGLGRAFMKGGRV